jgi:hypothetical protein
VAREGRGMYRKCSTNVRARAALAVLVVGVLGLAASPAALAMDRGGPGQPGAQQAASDDFLPVLPRKNLSLHFVSWTD